MRNIICYIKHLFSKNKCKGCKNDGTKLFSCREVCKWGAPSKGWLDCWEQKGKRV